MILRKTDTSKTVTTANTWQTAIDLSTSPTSTVSIRISADPDPIRLFDGNTKIEKYRIVPLNLKI
jgi:hypothetical protein